MLIVLSLFIFAILVLLIKVKFSTEDFITYSQIPKLWEALKKSGTNGSFAVVIFCPKGVNAEDSINIQFSIENDKPGIDWVLLSKTNIIDKMIFIKKAEENNCSIRKMNSNGVNYLRSEDGNPVNLFQSLIKYYHFKPDEKLELIIEGFEWGK